MPSKSSGRGVGAAILAILVLAVAPAAANADSVAVDGTTLKITLTTAGATAPRAFVEQSGDTFIVTDYNTGVTGCDPGEYNDVQVRRCTAPGVTRVVVTGTGADDYVGVYASLADDITTDLTLGAGEDAVDDQSGGPSIVDVGSEGDDVSTYGGVDEIHGGPGNDNLDGGDDGDEVFGDGGADTVFGLKGDDTLHGGDGNDTLYGSEGADTVLGDGDQDDLRGNEGPDTLDGGTGDDDLEGADAFDTAEPDALVGGPGTDTANYAARSNVGAEIDVTLDGLPNDGQDGAAEGDDVGPDGDVENVEIDDSDVTAVVIGDDGPNHLDVSSTAGGAVVDGRGEDDVIVGSSDSGQGDLLFGGHGGDTIDASSGDDEVHGDDGDDDLDGNTGGDEIEGGAGSDDIAGGSGNDMIEAHDGEVDGLGCGDGADFASVDSVDVIDASPFEVCEAADVRQVDRTPPETTVTGGPAEGALVDTRTVTFTFGADEDVTFECKLDDGALTDCTGGLAGLAAAGAPGAALATTGSATYADLPDGRHTFTVVASDAAGNVDATPATRSFRVDTTPPETTIASGPEEGSSQTATAATFAFTASEAGGSFRCALDGAIASACTSPATFTGLAEGSHTFAVFAVDAAGNVDATPASRAFAVATAPSGGGNTGGGDGNTGGGGGNTGGGGGATGGTKGPSRTALTRSMTSAAASGAKAVKKAGLKALAKSGSYTRNVKVPGKGVLTESVIAIPLGKATAAKKAKAVKFATYRRSFAKATTTKVKVKLTKAGKKLAKKAKKLKLTVATSFKAPGRGAIKKVKTATVKR